MGLTILESLQDKKPCGRRFRVKNESLKVIYDLVRKHMAEIEEAISRGYSWKQIDAACRESWQEQSDKAKGIYWWESAHLIADCYHAVKRKGTVHKKAKEKKTPLSFEVQVTKR